MLNNINLYSLEKCILAPNKRTLLKVVLPFEIPKSTIALIQTERYEIRVIGYEHRIEQTTDFHLDVTNISNNYITIDKAEKIGEMSLTESNTTLAYIYDDMNDNNKLFIKQV